MCIQLAACTVFAPDTRTPVDRAHELEAKCKGVSEDHVAALLTPSIVDSAEPAYSYVSGGPNGREARLRGARIHVRPMPGMSRESLTRELACHQMRVALSSMPVRSEDPYVLPGKWVTLDVESESDGFDVLVRSDTFDDARVIVERARAFAALRSP